MPGLEETHWESRRLECHDGWMLSVYSATPKLAVLLRYLYLKNAYDNVEKDDEVVERGARSRLCAC